MRDLPLELPLGRQDGVVRRAQLLAAGATDGDVRRWLRRRELVTAHPGVYVVHTGPMPWRQRAWAAVLWAAGDTEAAGLWGPSALVAHGHPHAPAHEGRAGLADPPIHVAVDRHRALADRPGVRVHRVAGLAERVRTHLSPPRDRYEDAVLDVAAAASRLEAVAVLTEAVSGRRTTAERLLAAAARRQRLSQRGWIEAVLHDTAAGTASVLEHGYLTRVERPHGLPRGRRQAAEAGLGGVRYRDVDYGGLLVELDGRAFHDDPRQRDRDLVRDLDAAVSGRRTVRLSWGQVYGRSCQTAWSVGALLGAGGWRGQVRHCPRCPGAAPQLSAVAG